MSLSKYYPTFARLWARLPYRPALPVMPAFFRPRNWFAWLTWRLVRRTLVSVVGLTTVIALFYAVENWRGRRAWAQAEASARARGEPTTLAEIISPPVPDEENFARAPLIVEMFSDGKDMEQKWGSRLRIVPASGLNPEPQFPSWKGSAAAGKESEDPAQKARAAEVRRRRALRPSAQANDRTDVPSTPTSEVKQVVPRRMDAWRAYLGTEDLITYMDRYADDLSQLADASRRPYSRLLAQPNNDPYAAKGNTSNGWDYYFGTSRVLRLRAEARLEQGDHVGAAEDVMTLLRMGNLMSQEHLLLYQLIANAVVHTGVEAMQNGLAEGVWTAEDIEGFEAELQRLDFLASGRLAFLAESVRLSTLLGQMAGSRVQRLKLIKPQWSGIREKIENIQFLAMPTGWMYQNSVRIVRFYGEGLLPLINAGERRVNFAKIKKLEGAYREKSWVGYRIISDLAVRNVSELAGSIAAGQTRIDLARAALALERWRRAEGGYPATLAELPAEWGVGGLHDLGTGEAFRYKRDENGGFVLYATGSDGVDDGGRPAPEGKAWGQGDWVW